MSYRPYQNSLINKIVSSVNNGAKSILLVAPTGSGKTKIVSKAMNKLNYPTLAFSHRVEIGRQIGEEFKSTGPQIFSVSGIRGPKVKTMLLDKSYKAVFIDEAHHVPAKSYQRLVSGLDGKVLIGATATPYRSDFVSVGKYFDTVIEAPNAKELTEAGYLAEVKYVSSDDVDFSGIKINVRKEYDEIDALNRVRISVQAGDLVKAWSKYAKRRNAIIYCINVEHGEQIAKELELANVPAMLITGKTGKKKREAAIRRFEIGEVRALINCQVFTEGTDVKNVGSIIMLRPTLSRGLYKQMIGRGMRPDLKCIVIDHVGNYMRHGCVLEENPVELMNSAKLAMMPDGNSRGIKLERVEMMDLHVEKVDSDLKEIWSPSIFGGPINE